MSQSWEKNAAIMDEQINQTSLGLFGQFLQKQSFFPKNMLRQFWVLIGPQIHAKYQKTNEPVLRKMLW